MEQTKGTRLGVAAVVAAAGMSVLAVSDAVVRGTGGVPVWDEATGSAAAVSAADAVHGLGYLVLATGLAAAGRRVDAGRRGARLLRRLIVADLVVLGAAFLGLAGLHAARAVVPGALGAVFGVSFALLFLLPVALGAVLLRRRGTRLPAGLLLGVVPALGVTFGLAAVAPDWAHPAYLETLVYVGLATLVVRTSPSGLYSEPHVADAEAAVA